VIVNVTAEEIENVFRGVGTKEPVVIPWREDGALVGLAMGFIEEWPEAPGKTAYLDCIVVTPEAKRKLEVMNLFPDFIAQLMRERGDIERIALCIGKNDPRHDRLEKWALRRGYTKYGTTDSRDWYVLPLKENE
jgi:acetyltransferase (GNAT) family protein